MSGVVDNAINAVRAIRKREQTRKEAEFQRAVANGLSYEDVIKIREKQLEEESVSSISDPDYMEILKVSIAETKKLNRYQKYRAKYKDALTELVAGKINEDNFNLKLKDTLNDVTDPALRLEIQGYIIQSEKDAKQYKDNILRNQVRVALEDRTENVLTDIIGRVNLARANALISDKQDDVTMHDEELTALNAQLSATRVENAISNVDVKSATTGFNPLDKLDYINAEIQKADPNTPVRIANRSYASAQQFWNLERDNFLAGSSTVFGKFFDDLKGLTENIINADSRIFKENSTMTLDNVKNVFDQLRVKPELAPFINNLNATQTSVMNDAVNKVAAKIVNIGSLNYEFEDANVQLRNLAKYGTDVEPYMVSLQERHDALVSQGEIAKEITTGIELPKIGDQPIKPATAPKTSTTPVVEKPTPEIKKQPAETAVPPQAGTGLPVSPAQPQTETPQTEGALMTPYTPPAAKPAPSKDELQAILNSTNIQLQNLKTRMNVSPQIKSLKDLGQFIAGGTNIPKDVQQEYNLLTETKTKLEKEIAIKGGQEVGKGISEFFGKISTSLTESLARSKERQVQHETQQNAIKAQREIETQKQREQFNKGLQSFLNRPIF